MKKSKFILTLSNDKIPIIAEVPKDRPIEKDERRISWSCVQANLAKGTFINLKSKVKYEGRIYGYAEAI
jgi:hypothetical protein